MIFPVIIKQMKNVKFVHLAAKQYVAQDSVCKINVVLQSGLKKSSGL